MSVGEFNANNRGDNVKGRLKGALNFWRNTLTASDFVLCIIEYGYRLPFADYPPPCFLPDNLSAIWHREFVSQAIEELLANKCIQVSLIVQTVRKLQSCNGFGTLVIPKWPSGLFWPFLYAAALAFKLYVKGVLILRKFPALLVEGAGHRAIYRGKTSVFSGCPAFDMLALRLDFAWQHDYLDYCY